MLRSAAPAGVRAPVAPSSQRLVHRMDAMEACLKKYEEKLTALEDELQKTKAILQSQSSNLDRLNLGNKIEFGGLFTE